MLVVHDRDMASRICDTSRRQESVHLFTLLHSWVSVCPFINYYSPVMFLSPENECDHAVLAGPFEL